MELIPLIIVILILVLTVALVLGYRYELGRDRANLDKNSRILKTPLGSIHFVILGEGIPIISRVWGLRSRGNRSTTAVSPWIPGDRGVTSGGVRHTADPDDDR